MKRSCWALDAYHHTCGDLAGQWVGWPAPRHVERQGRYWGAAGLGRQGEKVTWRVKGPKLKRGHRRIRIMQSYLTLTLHWWCEQTNGFLTFPLTPLWAASQVKTFSFSCQEGTCCIFITNLEKKWKHNKRFFVRNESCLSLSAGCLVCLGGTPDICHTSAAHHNIQPIFHLKQSAKYKYRHTNTNTIT